MNSHKYKIIDFFPDAKGTGFNWEKHNQQFRNSNILFCAASNNVGYCEHWGPLSMKCAFNGNEYYKVNSCTYSVHDGNYFIINDGNYYSSDIFSKKKVESFTINFTEEFTRSLTSGLITTDDQNLTSPATPTSKIEFHEALYQYDDRVRSIIFKLKTLIDNFYQNTLEIEELFYNLFAEILLKQKEIQSKILQSPVIRQSTKIELYKRLNRAKDFIDSCYTSELSLSEIAKVSFLNDAYFLRQFKKLYKITPRQYQIGKRLEAARLMLERSDASITEICDEVGYSDLSSFSKLFKKVYSYSPEKYREEIQLNG